MNRHILSPPPPQEGLWREGLQLNQGPAQHLPLIPAGEASQDVCVPGRTPSGGHSRTKGKRRRGLCRCRDKLRREQGTNCESQAAGAWLPGPGLRQAAACLHV